jgi:anti-anti-sigma factor
MLPAKPHDSTTPGSPTGVPTRISTRIPGPPLSDASSRIGTQSRAELALLRFDETRSHVAIRGALDVTGTRLIEMRFTSIVTARRLSAIVELDGVTFISSYAMCMVLIASRAIRQRGRLLVLVTKPGPTDEALKATRIHHLVPIVDSAAEAERLIAARESSPHSSGGS